MNGEFVGRFHNDEKLECVCELIDETLRNIYFEDYFILVGRDYFLDNVVPRLYIVINENEFNLVSKEFDVFTVIDRLESQDVVPSMEIVSINELERVVYDGEILFYTNDAVLDLIAEFGC